MEPRARLSTLAELPSETTARTFWQEGFLTALPGMARDLAERTGLIALGLFLVGNRRPLAHAFAGALVVELAVLLYFRPRKTP